MKTRVILKGGLGDILMMIYSGDLMGVFDAIAPGDIVQVVILSPCRGVAELFERHPNRSRLEIVDHEYVEPLKPDFFDAHGGPLPETPKVSRLRPVPRYVSTEDLTFLAKMPPKFVAFSLSSSHDNRNVPDTIAFDAARICVEEGLTVLLLGRNYEPWHQWWGQRWMGKRSEPVVDGPGIVNAIDLLSLPGALEAVHRASGVFCSLSAFQLAAWLQGKKSYVVTTTEFKASIEMISRYQIGRIRYANGHAIVNYVEEWSSERFRGFARGIS